MDDYYTGKVNEKRRNRQTLGCSVHGGVFRVPLKKPLSVCALDELHVGGKVV